MEDDEAPDSDLSFLRRSERSKASELTSSIMPWRGVVIFGDGAERWWMGR